MRILSILLKNPVFPNQRINVCAIASECCWFLRIGCTAMKLGPRVGETKHKYAKFN